MENNNLPVKYLWKLPLEFFQNSEKHNKNKMMRNKTRKPQQHGKKNSNDRLQVLINHLNPVSTQHLFQQPQLVCDDCRAKILEFHNNSLVFNKLNNNNNSNNQSQQLQQPPILSMETVSRHYQQSANLMFVSQDLRKALYDSKYENLRDTIYDIAAKEPGLFQIKDEEYGSAELQRKVRTSIYKNVNPLT